MCGCQNKINGIGRKKSSKMAKRKSPRRRRRISGLNSKDIQGVATSAVLGGAGAVVLKMILDKVLPAEYAAHTHYAQIGGGILLATMSKNTMLQAAGLGAATVGAAAVVTDLTDGVAGLGLLPPGVPSVRISGLAEPTGVVTQ